MMTGKSAILGFVDVTENQPDEPAIAQWSFDENHPWFHAPVKYHDTSIIEGPRAFEVFLEGYLYPINDNYVDTTPCVRYTNQTLQLRQYISNIALALDSNDSTIIEQALKQNIKDINLLILGQLENTTCGELINHNLTHSLEKGTEYLQYASISVNSSVSFKDLLIKINVSDFTQSVNLFKV